MPLQRTISPIDGSVHVEGEVASGREIDETLERARRAQREWRRVPSASRAAILTRFCEAFEQRRDAVGTEL
ncbi:MAG TPA: aldehyde dehydrogenase family protein, partial [Steroidobacteraceae bacterium]|nr:aldehyde dehydrogenase family protein [Steroidobacteraceae bacterium]